MSDSVAFAGTCDLDPSRGPIDAASFDFDGGLVLLDRASGTVRVYNGAAAALWRLLRHAPAPVDPIGEFAQIYGLVHAQAAADAGAMIGHWRSAGLLGPMEANRADATPAAAAPAPRSAAPLQRWRVAWQGRTFALAADPLAAGILQRLISVLAVEDGPADHSITLRREAAGQGVLLADGAEILRSGDQAVLLGAVCQALIERAYPQEQWLAWLHGGAVARGGAAAALIGPSGSGKSTLIASLLQRGFQFVSDDILPIAARSGQVFPWPLPVSLKAGSWPALEAAVPRLAQIPIESFRGAPERLLAPDPSHRSPGPQRLRALIFPTYGRGAATRLEAIRPLEAAARLMNDRAHLGFPVTPERVEAFLGWLAALPAYALTHDDLAEAGACLEQALKA